MSAGTGGGTTYLSERARPRVLHVLELGWDDNTVMVPAIARPDADQLIGLGIDEGNAAGEPLEAAEHPHHVFAVVGNGKGLQCPARCPGFPS